ncbi:BTAD domain-containing putative transcriptional regulator [Streptomyces sp. NPDC006207]
MRELSSGLQFKILGDLKVEDHGAEIALGPKKQRQVLLALLSRRDRFVSVNQIIDVVWPEGAPDTARKNLNVYVSNLRAILNRRGQFGRIIYRQGSYKLIARNDETDVGQFEDLVGMAREAMSLGRNDQACSLLRRSLDLWPTPPTLNGFRGNADMISEYGDWLYEQYVSTLELWAEIGGISGDPAAIADKAARILHVDPAREQLVSCYMRALVTCGRRSDALSAYEKLRLYLARELGISPSGSLQRLYDELLADPAVQFEEEMAGLSLLPKDLADFFGMSDALAELKEGVSERSGSILVWGPAGTGKTSLAVHFAHGVSKEFTGGRIFVNVSDEEGRARSISSMLKEVSYGIGESPVFPEDKEAAVAAWHRWLADRSCLIIFDDVSRSHEFSKLMPRTGGSVAIVTSRFRLGGLGFDRRIRVPEPDYDEAMQLLRVIAGDLGYSEWGNVLKRACAVASPLRAAIRILGAKLSSIPGTHLSEYAASLNPDTLTLGTFDYDGLSLRGIFDRQWRDLSSAQRVLLRHIGQTSHGTLDVQESMNILSCDYERAASELGSLAEQGCLEPVVSGRNSLVPSFKMPKFLSLYVREVSAD